MSDEEPVRPVLRVVKGDPTPEELAVLTALVTAASGDAGDSSAPRGRRGGWNDPAMLQRKTLIAGPNAWSSSLR